MKFQPPTPEVLAILDNLLAQNGINRRVVDGRLNITPTRGPLRKDDLGLIKHYAEPLARWITDGSPTPTQPPKPRRLAAPVGVGGCPECGETNPDRHVWRVDRAGDLLNRCVPCGCAWRWSDPADVVQHGREHKRDET